MNAEIMNKLKKLFELSKSDNEHEAALAGERAAELMAKHQIDAAEVYARTHEEPQAPERGRIDAEENDPVSKREERWMGTLISAIAMGLGGLAWRAAKYRIFQYFMMGPPGSVAAARYLYMALSREINRISRTAQRARGESNAWRRAFALGMVINVHTRLQEGRKRVLSTETAMVHVSKMDVAIKVAMDAMKLKDAKVGTMKRPDAQSEGYVAGEQLDIGDFGRPRIGSGPKQLK
jgi:hypothetical protein